MASEDFFVTEFGWGEDWASDHSPVIPVRECSKVTLFFIFSLVAILKGKHGMSLNQMFDFIKTCFTFKEIFG